MKKQLVPSPESSVPSHWQRTCASIWLLIIGYWLCAAAAPGARAATLLTLPNTVVTTNTFAEGVLDLTGAGTVAIQATFTGQPLHTTTALVGITNTTTGGEIIRLVLAGTARSYFFTNSPTTNFSALSASAPVIKVGITNTTATNGQSLVIILNARTNTYTWTNAVADSPFVLTNNTAAKSTTNLYGVLKADFDALPITRSVSITYASATLLSMQAQVNDRFSSTISGDWATNLDTSIYTVTNTVATNLYHLLAGTAAISTTNLYNAITTDYSVTLGAAYVGTSNLQFQTPFGEAFTLTNTVAMGTNLITTNAISGTVTLRASNSLDRVTWFPDVAHNLTMAYSTTATITLLTNFASGSYPFWTYSVENPGTAWGNPQNFRFQYHAR